MHFRHFGLCRPNLRCRASLANSEPGRHADLAISEPGRRASLANSELGRHADLVNFRVSPHIGYMGRPFRGRLEPCERKGAGNWRPFFREALMGIS